MEDKELQIATDLNTGQQLQIIGATTICRLCASQSERLIGIYSEEGITNDLSNKINLYLPIKVGATDDLPLQCCWNCASTLLAWHELVLTCVEVERKFRGSQFVTEKQIADDGVFDHDNTESQLSDDNDICDNEGLDRFDGNIMALFKAIKQQQQQQEEAKQPEVIPPSQQPEVVTPAEQPEVTPTEAELPVQQPLVVNTPLKPPLVVMPPKQPVVITPAKYPLIRPGKQLLVVTPNKRKLLIVKPPKRQQLLIVKPTKQLPVVEPPKQLPVVEPPKQLPVVEPPKQLPVVEPPKRLPVINQSKQLQIVKAKKPLPIALTQAPKFVSEEVIVAQPQQQQQQQQQQVNRLHGPLLDPCMYPVEVEKNMAMKCEICERVLSCRSNYVTHLKVHVVDHYCRICCNSYNTKFKLNAHVATHGADAKDAPQQYVKCDFKDCSAQFPSKLQLHNHKDSHYNFVKFKCHECGVVFWKESALENHKLKHVKLVCKICFKQFANKKTLRDHRRIHTGEKPFKCQLCGESFRCHSGLKYHEVTHSKEKKYGCSQCGMFFLRSNYLKDHLRIHAKEKPHECKYCHEKFVQMGVLKRHVIRMHAKCQICDKVVGKRADVKDHMLIYHRRKVS